jgi:hypothetical protein
VDVDGVRYLSLDYTLFTNGGEDEADVSKKKQENVHALFPIRHKVCGWLKESLKDAQQKVGDIIDPVIVSVMTIFCFAWSGFECVCGWSPTIGY